MKSKVLHVHSDYPDGRDQYPFTRAVSNLVAAADGFNHYVVSINRTSNLFKVSMKSFDEGLSFVYWCLPVPGLYRVTLWIFCKYLNFFLRNVDFDIIHGHKLTIDGIVVSYLSAKRSKPYCLSVRGGTDLGYIRRFPGMKKVFSRVLNNAECVFWLAPWTKTKVCHILQATPQMDLNLPNFCKIPELKPSRKTGPYKIFTVANYKHYKRKAVPQIIEAVSILREEGQQVSLDIYGSGDEHVKQLIASTIQALKLDDCVYIKGQVEHATLIQQMCHYSALVLPSINETFGMVFVEALAAKVPFIGHVNSGVHGYFDGEYAVFLDSQEPAELAQAIKKMLNNQETIQRAIEDLHRSGRFREFTKEGVVRNYTAKMNAVLNRPSC